MTGFWEQSYLCTDEKREVAHYFLNKPGGINYGSTLK